MSEELTKYGGDNNLPALKQLEHFQMLLNKEPDAALADLDAAVAAIPPNDPVFTQDICGKRLTSCKLRFGADSLNFGGFPGVGK